MIAFFTFVCRMALLKSDISEVGQCFRRFITIPKMMVLGIVILVFGGDFMRKRTRSSVDRKVFRRTAVSTKKININPKVYRGGIRL